MKNRSHQFVLTKIIATLGPASASLETMVRLIDEGTRVFRINFSHGTFEQFEALLNTVREASKQTHRYIGVLGDLSGPKFRLGKVVEGGVSLEPEDTVELTAGDGLGAFVDGASPRRAVLPVKNPVFLPEVKVGQRILLDDGNVVLECTQTAAPGDTPAILCRVVTGGLITSSKGVNLPDTDLSLPSLTDWDRQCVDFAVEKGFDFLALSFVRSAKDVRVLKDRLRELGARPSRPKKSDGGRGPKYSSYGGGSRAFIPIVAKIEKPQALDELEKIVDEADVIMVARGDLGVEMDLAQVPVIQKRIIQTCQDYGKPVVVATQMLQSMIEAPAPTRAEASDVANAIFDGADAVMLSGETAVGRYPVEAVQMMRRIARRTTDYRRAQPIDVSLPRKPRQSKYRTAALAHGVSVIVRDLDASMMVMWSQQGGGASYLSQHRLPVPILGFSSSPAALCRMSILYGVVPVFMEQPAFATTFIEMMDAMLLERGWADKGDSVVMVLGEPIGQAGLTNSIRIHYVGDV